MADDPVQDRFAFVARSETMRLAVAQADEAARLGCPVILRGERGSGRTRFARRIHAHAAAAPLLFHDAEDPTGRVSDASAWRRARERLLDVIDGGTLVVRALHDPGPELLRTLGTDSYLRFRVIFIGGPGCKVDPIAFVGTDSAPVELRPRRVDVPPLCRRLADLPELVSLLLQRRSPLGGPVLRRGRVTSDCLEALESYHWPGNVSELERVLVRAACLAGETCIPSRRHLPVGFRRLGDPNEIDLSRPLAEVESDYVIRVVRECGGNKLKAARRLGIHRNSVRRKLRRINSAEP